MSASQHLLDRYGAALLPVFGRPLTALVRGSGARVWDADGREYVDLLAGIAVNVLGHAHPALVEAVSAQVAGLAHVSNFFTTAQQVELAEEVLLACQAPAGSAVFFTNSGTEALEAAIKLSRRTGRTRIVAAENAFHGRSTGALALTWKPAYREPFEPLLPQVIHVPYDDIAALGSVVDDTVAAVMLEPIQGEAGVVPASAAYLRAARELTSEHGALLVLDEVQTGVGRTGTWLAHHECGITPDAVTLAKGLAGGVPIGALVTYGPAVSGLLAAGQHGSTFGGNPLACAAGLAVLRTIASDGLVERAARLGRDLARDILAVGDPRIVAVRGRGLLLGVELAAPVAPAFARAAFDAGFIVNAATPSRIRLAPPLVVRTDDLESFVGMLPALLDSAYAEVPA
jgi:acetylornithine/N-succinyldiaminopimelate aminotransferase